MITIYGKPECKWCKKAKELAIMQEISFTYINISVDEDSINKIKKDGFTTIPAIYDDEKIIGGFVEFEKESIGLDDFSDL